MTTVLRPIHLGDLGVAHRAQLPVVKTLSVHWHPPVKVHRVERKAQSYVVHYEPITRSECCDIDYRRELAVSGRAVFYGARVEVAA